MGYSLVSSYMLTVPPAVFSTITTLLVSRYADKWHVRGPVCWAGTAIGLAGVAMVGFAESPVARYAGIWVGEIGTNAYIVTCVAWGHNNIRTDGPRAVLSSIHVGSAAVGAIYSSLVFRQQVRNTDSSPFSFRLDTKTDPRGKLPSNGRLFFSSHRMRRTMYLVWRRSWPFSSRGSL
jgi:hypothetical protein